MVIIFAFTPERASGRCGERSLRLKSLLLWGHFATLRVDIPCLDFAVFTAFVIQFRDAVATHSRRGVANRDVSSNCGLMGWINRRLTI